MIMLESSNFKIGNNLVSKGHPVCQYTLPEKPVSKVTLSHTGTFYSRDAPYSDKYSFYRSI